jgi:hypothetical protein
MKKKAVFPAVILFHQLCACLRAKIVVVGSFAVIESKLPDLPTHSKQATHRSTRSVSNAAATELLPDLLPRQTTSKFSFDYVKSAIHHYEQIKEEHRLMAETLGQNKLEGDALL